MVRYIRNWRWQLDYTHKNKFRRILDGFGDFSSLRVNNSSLCNLIVNLKYRTCVFTQYLEWISYIFYATWIMIVCIKYLSETNGFIKHATFRLWRILLIVTKKLSLIIIYYSFVDYRIPAYSTNNINILFKRGGVY